MAEFSKEVPGLLQGHFGHLLESGISIEVIRERGYRSILDVSELLELGFSEAQCSVPGILIPLRPPDGSGGSHQYRPDIPRTKRGKAVKYETPKGGRLRLDVPPRCRKDIDDPNVPLWVTEGLKKGDALASRGLCAMSLVGVWGSRGTNVKGGKLNIADWGDIALNGREVTVCFDSDQSTNVNVKAARDYVVALVTNKGARPRVAVVPPGANNQKLGVDDYLLTHSVDELIRLSSDSAISSSDAISTEKEGSFLTLDNYIYEEIYRDAKASFVGYNIDTGEVKTLTCVMDRNVKIMPQQGEELALGAIKLPSDIAEYVNMVSLLRDIETHIRCYLDVSDAFRKFGSYYVLLSWLYDRFNTLPYLRFLGDTGTGKSRGLDVIGGLCYRPTIVSGCITPAPIYRMLRRWGGTMVLDEADLKNSDEYNEVVTILNCGFEKGRPVIRATKDNPDKLQFLPTFGPKVFATRRRFKDTALEARCLTEIMSETPRDDIPSTLTSKFNEEQERIRNKLLLFRLRNYNRVSPEESVTLEFRDIEPRLKQISSCFCCLFVGQPDALEDFKVFIKNHQRELIEQRAATPVGQVVEQLFSLIDTDTVETIETLDTGEKLFKVSAGDIADKLNNMDARLVGQILKTLGLHTKATKVSGSVKRCIVFEKSKLNVIRRRYIQSEDDSVSSVSKVSRVTGLREDSVKNGVGI